MLQLTEVAKSNDAAIAIFDELSQRLRHRNRTDLRTFYRELVGQYGNISETQFMSVFKELENLALGSIVIGRGKNPTRFFWNYDLKDVAKVAKGVMDQKEMVVKPKFQKKSNVHPIETSRVVTIKKPETTAKVTVLVLDQSGDIQRHYVSAEKQVLFKSLLEEFASK